MVVILVHHDCKPGMLDAAVLRLDANGDRMATFPGFLFRYRVTSPERPNRLSTLTGWRALEDHEHWLRVRRSGDPGPVFTGENPYENTITEVLNVDRAQ